MIPRGAVIALIGCGGCASPTLEPPPQVQPQPQVVTSARPKKSPLSVTYKVYCARKLSGCLARAAPDPPLATVEYDDGRPYRGDEAMGFLCTYCAAQDTGVKK